MEIETEQFFEQHKKIHGTAATYVWIFTSVLLFLTHSEGPGLFSWQAALFVLVGMFVAAIVAGNLTYWLQRKVAKRLALTFDTSVSIEEQASKVRQVGVYLLFVDGVLAALFTFWVYQSTFMM